MKILEYNNFDEDKNRIEELKKLDPTFSYNPNTEKLFFFIFKETIRGFGILNLAENEAILKNIFIEKKYRNNGYGTILLKYMINWLINNNYDRLLVLNHKKMDNFLEKQRFIRTKDDKGYELNSLSEQKKEKSIISFVARFSILINVVLATLKLVAGNIFKSSSLLADGLNSMLDLISNILVIFGIKVGNNPEDAEHPFGHGKIEPVFSVIIGTIIMMTAFDLIKDSTMNFFMDKSNIIITPITIITIIAIIVKVFQFLFIKNRTKKYKSSLINSLLKDYKADIIITTSVLIGILLSKIHPKIDNIVGFLIALYIFREGYYLIKENALILMDSQDKELLEKIKNDIYEFDGIENAHEFRMTTSGKDIFIFADIRVKKDLTVDEAHEITNEISKGIKHKYKNVKKVLLHIEPMYNIE